MLLNLVFRLQDEGSSRKGGVKPLMTRPTARTWTADNDIQRRWSTTSIQDASHSSSCRKEHCKHLPNTRYQIEEAERSAQLVALSQYDLARRYRVAYMISEEEPFLEVS